MIIRRKTSDSASKGNFGVDKITVPVPPVDYTSKWKDSAMVQKLEELGLTHWQKGDYDRMYISKPEHIEVLFGLKLTFYKNGGISHAELYGEKISNREAMSYYDAVNKPYYDCIKGEFCGIGLECRI